MTQDISADRLRLVRTKAEEWATALIDLSSRNLLLHFKHTKTASLDLSQSEPAALEKLLRGAAVKLTTLFPEPERHKDACQRARNLRRKITAFEEEQGVDVGKLAHGLVRANAPVSRGTTPVPPLRAPLLLRTVQIDARTITENDFVLQAADDVEINPVLLHALDRKYGLEVDRERLSADAEAVLASTDDPAEQVDGVFQLIAALTEGQGTVAELERSTVIGLFNYEKLPMVDDLNRATELLASHDLIAAIAGYQPAVADLRAEADAYTAPAPDDIPPSGEFFVQDADSSQQRAILTALAGHHVLIEGPPGTGKSQTIANIIAGASAQGKRVLFVAEKRAAIEAVTERLAAAGLDDLVFDLHQQKLDKKQVAQQLQHSLDAATRQRPVEDNGLHDRLAHRRQVLRAYSDELHRVRAPWGLSAYQVLDRLVRVRKPRTGRTFRGSTLRALDQSTVDSLSQGLREFVEAGGLRVVRMETPWWQADIRDEHDIENVLYELDSLTTKTLDEGQRGMHALLRQTGLPVPHDLAGWQQVLVLLEGVHRSVTAFGPDVFGTHLDSWCCATAPRAERSRYGTRLSWSARRSLLKQIRAASQDHITRKKALHAKLREVTGQRDHWRQLGGSQVRPAEVVDLQRVSDTFQVLRDQLTAVAMCARLADVEKRPTDEVESHLEALKADEAMLWQLPKITRMIEDFQRLGLMDLIDEAARSKATGDQAWAMFEDAWLRSLLDEFKLRVPALREFVGEQQTRLVSEFRDADAEHRDSSAQRVRWAVARALRRARDEFPDQTRLLKTQASKKTRHLPIRKLVEKSSDVLLALRPCWAMSPLVVSKTLPAAQLFDLVVFDEASQIEPHDAITSVARGRRLVVAGDDKQLPPTNFFGRLLDGADNPGDDEESDDIKDYDSILMVMRALVPNKEMLRWHYRSRDERLIAFSNQEIYANQLVTFPGAFRETPVSLDVVDGIASPGQDGSAPAEIERVVQLVLAHAEQRPGESLGVITLGQKHMDRVEAAVRTAVRERPDLQAFFSEDAGPGRRFFVKNLERVQGDERDAIILTVGVAKKANGTLARTGFGPLNSESGTRRWNVAVTRAKRRMTVVSSFGPADLAPSDTVTGTELLRRYLEFAQAQNVIENVGRREGAELNGFELDIETALRERGITVHAQWGFSGYRIDFALAHRDQPGRMVLAVEADGDSYHRTYSTRDRDRLRQNHLENLGWRFHRVWSSAWYADRTGETDRIVKAWEEAMLHGDREPEPSPRPVVRTPVPAASERGPRPPVRPGLKIQEYSHAQLTEICGWLMTDRLLLDREDRIEQVLRELGFQRRGSRIVERLGHAVDAAQRQADREMN
ncbi:AAA domain-containing protein [Amycolatopsis magusensis]|uniref:AAA domain-containing protein n=1 Tax=Amycolatopsis magusensis TaxID=882444 RepID=UPI0037BE1907